MAREAALELSLFVGPRASWETGATAVSGAGKVLGAQHRGQDQLAYALEDVLRGVSLGLRGVLVADAGLLWVLRDLKAKGELPEDLDPEGISVQLAAANAAAVKAMEDLGANTYNVPTDLSLPNSPRYVPLPSSRSTCTSRCCRRLRRVREALRDTGPRKGRIARLRQVRPEERAEHLPQRDAPGGDRGRARKGEGQARQDRTGDAGRYYPGPRLPRRARPSPASRSTPR